MKTFEDLAILAKIRKNHSTWLNGNSAIGHADLAGVDCTGWDFSTTDSTADFRYAVFCGANMSNASCYKINFQFADLRKADFTNAERKIM